MEIQYFSSGIYTGRPLDTLYNFYVTCIGEEPLDYDEQISGLGSFNMAWEGSILDQKYERKIPFL